MFRFWYRYVSGNRTLFETDAQEIIWDKRIEPDYSNYMGHVFEIICRDYLLHKNSKGKLPILFSNNRIYVVFQKWIYGILNAKTEKSDDITLVTLDDILQYY